MSTGPETARIGLYIYENMTCLSDNQMDTNRIAAIYNLSPVTLLILHFTTFCLMDIFHTSRGDWGYSTNDVLADYGFIQALESRLLRRGLKSVIPDLQNLSEHTIAEASAHKFHSEKVDCWIRTSPSYFYRNSGCG